MLGNNTDALLALTRAGLWENDVWLSKFKEIDFEEVYRLSEEQAVIGLAAAGFEHVIDIKAPKALVLRFVGQTLQMEQLNQAMNDFIGELIGKMRAADIYTLLVKGQGIAQCYERPLWRSSGDVDLLLSDSNYNKAKDFLLQMSNGNKPDERYSKHLGMNIDPWYVEIHGTLRTGLSGRVDKVVDEVQKDVFYGGNVRSWNNGNTQVFLPAPDNDVFFVFTHFIKHFYKEGMNLRQICDWCRLLWTYRDTINRKRLESWIRKAGLMSEWKAFAALAVDYLGIPNEAMPLYDSSNKWSQKAERLVNHILNGGSNRTVLETWSISKVFPRKTICYMPSIFFNVNWLKVKERLIGQ